jgi:hypothetical protein
MERNSSLTASLDEMRDELTQRTADWDEERKESLRKSQRKMSLKYWNLPKPQKDL